MQQIKLDAYVVPIGRYDTATAVLDTGKPLYALVIQRVGVIALAVGIAIAVYGMVTAT